LTRIITLIAIAHLISCCAPKEVVVVPTPIATPLAKIKYRGGDLSFLPEIEAAGAIFKSGTSTQTAFDILKSKGMNLVRVRIWHTPVSGHSGLNEVLALAKRTKDAGLDFYLDFHYADDWADPGKQPKPAAWLRASISPLMDSVYNYTQKVMQALKAQGTMPAIVQIGNETNNGMLWDLGRIGGSFDSNWSNYAELTKKGIAAVRAVDADNKVKIMLHYAGTDGAEAYFKHLDDYAVPYNIMGISYYPWWHGNDTTKTKNVLISLANTYNKDILIAETAYPFTLQWNDYTNNTLGNATGLIADCPISPEGQAKFLGLVRNLVRAIPNNHGLGFCYWAPEWTAYRGPISTTGSTWENLTVFDFNNVALPAADMFGE
jgi:arabinogalactan endo-1,4-beta-galactosidase